MAEDTQHTGSSVTALLTELGHGNRELEDRLAERLYGELRRIAAAHMRRERGDHTLEPTALVNEAWMRLAEQPGAVWQNRSHFYAVASRLMRQILVDHARRKRAGKRGGEQRQVTLTGSLAAQEAHPIDILILDEALHRLNAFDARACRIVELHFFGGLSFDEIAGMIGISMRTAKRDWTMARAWLRSELSNSK